MSKDSGVGGAHNLDQHALVSVEEATRRQLELNQARRQQRNATIRREDERVRREIAKAQAAKVRRMAKNPYDFS